MSLTLERSTKKKPAVITGLGLPQVNLLPPEVRAARGLVNVKRWLALSLVLVVIVAALAYGFTILLKHNAAAELADAQTETVRLQQEEAKYAEVPQVLGDLARTEQARVQGMSTDILWKQYLDAITAVLPAGVSIDTFTVTQASPWLAAPIGTDALLDPGVGSILFTVRASTLPDSAAWLDGLEKIPGFKDATFSAAALNQTDGAPFYAVTSTVQVVDAALSHRFDQTQED
jgi:Tfp pilus assembly protein PilN